MNALICLESNFAPLHFMDVSRGKMSYWFNANKKENNIQTSASQKPKVLYIIYISKTHIKRFIALGEFTVKTRKCKQTKTFCN